MWTVVLFLIFRKHSFLFMQALCVYMQCLCWNCLEITIFFPLWVSAVQKSLTMLITYRNVFIQVLTLCKRFLFHRDVKARSIKPILIHCFNVSISPLLRLSSLSFPLPYLFLSSSFSLFPFSFPSFHFQFSVLSLSLSFALPTQELLLTGSILLIAPWISTLLAYFTWVSSPTHS